MSQSEQRIFNYELQPEGKQIVQMHKGAQILGVIEKYGLPFVLAVVDEEQPVEPRAFRVVTTGEIFNPEILFYVGTLRLGGDGPKAAWYTMHVFEVETALRPMRPDPIHARFKDDLAEVKRELTGASTQ